MFGPDARNRVWLVHGGTPYVDRNGNGDLTEPGEKVPAAGPKEEGYTFEVGDLTVGSYGAVHLFDITE